MLNTQILKFCCCAFVATSTDFVAYYFLLNFLPTSIAKGISFILCATVAYHSNKYFTFKNNNSSGQEVSKFIKLYTSTFFVNVSTNKLALLLIPKFSLMCFVIAAATTMTCNFLGQKFYVFKS